jgi:hypothetical protein
MVSLPTPDDALASLPNNDRWQQHQHQHHQREVPPSSTRPQDDAPKLTTQRYEEIMEEEVQNKTNHLPATNRNVGIFVKSHGNEVSEIRRIDKKDNNKEEVNKDDDESTKSVFSLDSFHRNDVRWTAKTTTTKSSSHHHHHHRAARVSTHNDAPLFASVVVIERGINYLNDHDDDTTTNNICPCRCIYFTMRETTCLIISAMGCGVFLAGIISLCFYLSGWWNEISD